MIHDLVIKRYSAVIGRLALEGRQPHLRRLCPASTCSRSTAGRANRWMRRAVYTWILPLSPSPW